MKTILVCFILLMCLSIPVNAEYGWTIECTMDLPEPTFQGLNETFFEVNMMGEVGMGASIGWNEYVDVYKVEIVKVELPAGVTDCMVDIALKGDGLTHTGIAKSVSFIPYSAKQVVVVPMTILSVTDENIITPYVGNGLFPVFKSIFDNKYIGDKK